MGEHIDFKGFSLFFLLGFIISFLVIVGSMKGYEKISETENGYTVVHDGKFYKLVEINSI